MKMQVDEASASIIWRRRAEPHPSGSRILEEVKSSGLRQLCSSCRSSLVSCKWDRSRGGNPSHLQHNKDTFVNLGEGGNKVFKSCRPRAFLQTESTKKKTTKKRMTSSTLLWVIQLKCLPQCFWQPTWAPAPKENVFSRTRKAVAESKKLQGWGASWATLTFFSLFCVEKEKAVWVNILENSIPMGSPEPTAFRQDPAREQ